MKIAIISSIHFAKETLETKKKLEQMGHTVTIPVDAQSSVDKSESDDYLDFVMKHDLLMKGFRRIKDSDAILVINHEKNGIRGYIGGASLMEIGVAYYLGRKIYILNELPEECELSYMCEVRQAKPIILAGDLSKIE